MSAEIEIRYSCHQCGLKDQTVKIPARHPKENVRDWMHTLTVYASEDHRARSPGCNPETLAEVKIPLEDGAPIGGAVEH